MRLALAVLGLAAAQIPTQPLGMPAQQPSVGTFEHYGLPQPVELSDVRMGSYQRRPVIVRADVIPLDLRGQYWQLSDGGGSAVLMVVGELAGTVHDLMGRRVQVTGLVRELVTQQGTCRGPNFQTYPDSYCKDPDLPPTPDLTGDRVGWPNWSITAWSLSDAGGPSGRKRTIESAGLPELLSAATVPDKDVRVAGRFCGANLCGGDLGEPPEPSAWAVEEDGTAVWVIGKPPRGKGWQLDPVARGDTLRWLEVVGRLVPCTGHAGTRCLRARMVTLIPRPAAAASP